MSNKKEEKEPRTNVPSKRIKKAHRAFLKFMISEDTNQDGISLKQFAQRESDHDGKYKDVADAWFLNKALSRG